ncbi:MAG: Heat-inducible transcription repressor HrcA [Candidatus Tokpelaia sp. JSC085]|nr:MAG: Heat-inducible transcription repressor HrcA [Candidatus Tokpelaia sp. JSC085]
MSDLEKLGLIYAPHVSAGRMPTESGLRFFVDVFMETSHLPQQKRKSIEMQINSAGCSRTLEQFLTEESQILAGLSLGPGLVLATRGEGLLQHIITDCYTEQRCRKSYYRVTKRCDSKTAY